MDEEDDDLFYVCQACGHEDHPDNFGQFCPMCGDDLDEIDGDTP